MTLRFHIKLFGESVNNLGIADAKDFTNFMNSYFWRRHNEVIPFNWAFRLSTIASGIALFNVR